MSIERTLNLIHNEFKMLEPMSKVLDIEEYTEEDFLASINGGSKAFKVFKRRAYEEYKTLKFPAWKRVPLNKFSLKRPIPDANFELMGPKIYKRLFEMDESEEILTRGLDFQGSDRKFTLLADSFSTDGIIVRTEKAANYAETLICKFTSESQLASNLIIVEENSKLNMVFYTPGGDFSAITSRFLLKKGAELNLLFVNLSSAQSHHFSNNYYVIGEKAKLRLYDVNLGGTVVAPYHLVKTVGQGASANVKPLFFPVGNEKIDMLYLGRIIAPESSIEIEGIGTVTDSSKAVFRGSIEINKNAKNSSGNEHSSTIILSDKAIVQAIPGLFVDENDVNASHAASIGSIENDKIYYLMTRGLSKSEALKLIVAGAFEPVFQEIKEIFDDEVIGGVRNVFSERIR
ncbi:MAG: SufD family Fe-S cluster assembly protein [Kosmotoga sp.]|uniref:SufD family Fe-S cluster assembly protein n=1 Tax=Kosmotoga sp. TaxID=1955248 RepID=UPI0025C51F58|nr:SufD family Fe-S cluster assembly protein [Kosmotoga sp.]MCD6159069.1 SufD family Fe-S cluster assembly protein [Kosmotoga sp.]